MGSVRRSCNQDRVRVRIGRLVIDRRWMTVGKV